LAVANTHLLVSTPPADTVTVVLPPPTILICEDEEPLRELVRAALGDAYRFEEAIDGREALDLARRLEPDLVVLDVMLPGTSGLDVLATLRDDPSTGRIPVVVITAWTHAQQEVLDAGAERFVSKPFDPDELKQIVEELLAAPR
jgi:two-component system phosphate regulon response regulator PhoB